MIKLLVRFIKSLRFRFFILLFIFGLVPGFVMQMVLLHIYEDRAVEMRTSEISSQATLLATQVASSGYLEDTSSEVVTAQLNQLSNLYDGRVMLIDKAFHIVKDSYELDENKTKLSSGIWPNLNLALILLFVFIFFL